MERTKKFRFNILDVVIIIVAVACIAGLVIRSNLADKFTMKDEHALVTFEAYGMLDKTVDATLIPGDKYYCDVTKGVFGEFNQVIGVRDALYVYPNNEGIQCETTVPYRTDVTGTFVSTGYFDDGAFFIDGTNKLAPGETYEVYSENRKMTIHIISVEPVE